MITCRCLETSKVATAPSDTITNPGVNDMLLGLGKHTTEGNIRLGALIVTRKPRYIAASRFGKEKVACDVTREWRAMKPPGRFLAELKGKPGSFYNVGDEKACELVLERLRKAHTIGDAIPITNPGANDMLSGQGYGE